MIRPALANDRPATRHGTSPKNSQEFSEQRTTTTAAEDALEVLRLVRASRRPCELATTIVHVIAAWPVVLEEVRKCLEREAPRVAQSASIDVDEDDDADDGAEDCVYGPTLNGARRPPW